MYKEKFNGFSTKFIGMAMKTSELGLSHPFSSDL